MAWVCNLVTELLVGTNLCEVYAHSQRRALHEHERLSFGLFSMSPLPRLHHHDIMTIVGLFMYRQYIIYIYVLYTYRSYVRNDVT